MYDFLIFFREERVATGVLGKPILWIDALSINQRDSKEKAREVRCMSDIYSAADRVFVWLGQAAADIPNDVSLFLDDWRASAPQMELVTSRLMRNPYGLRAWCTQELVVNERVNVCIGTSLLSWTSFAQIALGSIISWWKEANRCVGHTESDLSDENWFPVRLLQSGSVIARFHFISELRKSISARKPPTLLTLLPATQHCDCKIPSDRIYSLWSVASDAVDLVPDINYLKTDEEVYRNFTQAWVKKYRSLDILAFAEYCACSKSSWIPNWSIRRRSWPLLAPSAVITDCEVGNVEDQSLYDASRGAPGSPFFVQDEEGLKFIAAGIVFDKITYVFDKWVGLGLPTLGRWETVSQSLVGDLEHYLESIDAECSVESANLDLFDALVAGKHCDGTERRETERLGVAHPSNEIMVLTLVGDKIEKAQKITDTGSPWTVHLLLVTAGRRLAITQSGHVGLVPRNTQVGDEVVTIFSRCMPLILGRIGTTTTREIIGECYFRRIMHGEAVQAGGGREACDREISCLLEEPKASQRRDDGPEILRVFPEHLCRDPPEEAGSCDLRPRYFLLD